jgi:hypothetical protein
MVAVCVVVLAAPLIDRWLETGWLAPLSLVAFVVGVVLLTLARLDAFRDESGWHWRLVERTLGDVWVGVIARADARNPTRIGATPMAPE